MFLCVYIILANDGKKKKKSLKQWRRFNLMRIWISSVMWAINLNNFLWKNGRNKIINTYVDFLSTWIFQLLYGNRLRSTNTSIFNCDSINLIAVFGPGNDRQGLLIYRKGIRWWHKPAKLSVMTVRRAPVPQSDACSISAPVLFNRMLCSVCSHAWRRTSVFVCWMNMKREIRPLRHATQRCMVTCNVLHVTCSLSSVFVFNDEPFWAGTGWSEVLRIEETLSKQWGKRLQRA